MAARRTNTDVGWGAARTHVASADTDDEAGPNLDARVPWTEPASHVRWTEPQSVVRWTEPDTRRRWRSAEQAVWMARLRPASDGSLDDFSGGLEQRRLERRAGLDDFATVVTWNDG